jgi:DNA-directed RNA polymerase subunit RPC12/RpoP
MPAMVGYRCESCGHGFVKPVLSEREKEEARRERRQLFSIVCEKCGSPNVKRVS